MSGFNPGAGWRMEQFDRSEVPVDAVAYHEADDSWTYWVREVPVPSLPTAPYTVIRVTHPGGDQQALMRAEGGYWVAESGIAYAGEQMEITGFEVLSEPRAVTAKAILDRLHELMGRTDDSVLRYRHFTTLEQEFGVES